MITHTAFNNTTTGEDVMQGIDLSGKTAIVTGGYSGIGLETVKALHAAGATIILPARNPDAVKELFPTYTDRLEIAAMDLMEPDSIDVFAHQFLSSRRPLHLLINNAGIMASPLNRDRRGYESQFATNHLGHFQLSLRLWPALAAAEGARIVTVSSLGHRYSDILYADPNFNHTPYDRWKAYGQSKTANILFAIHSDRLGQSSGIRSYALHPGRILDTNLKKYLTEGELIQLGIVNQDGSIKDNAGGNLKTINQGAATTLFCATSSSLNDKGGIYCENCNIAAVASSGTDLAKMTEGVLPYAIDPANADRLWELSCELTGLSLQ